MVLSPARYSVGVALFAGSTGVQAAVAASKASEDTNLMVKSRMGEVTVQASVNTERTTTTTTTTTMTMMMMTIMIFRSFAYLVTCGSQAKSATVPAYILNRAKHSHSPPGDDVMAFSRYLTHGHWCIYLRCHFRGGSCHFYVATHEKSRLPSQGHCLGPQGKTCFPLLFPKRAGSAPSGGSSSGVEFFCRLNGLVLNLIVSYMVGYYLCT